MWPNYKKGWGSYWDVVTMFNGYSAPTYTDLDAGRAQGTPVKPNHSGWPYNELYIPNDPTGQQSQVPTGAMPTAPAWPSAPKSAYGGHVGAVTAPPGVASQSSQSQGKCACPECQNGPSDPWYPRVAQENTNTGQELVYGDLYGQQRSKMYASCSYNPQVNQSYLKQPDYGEYMRGMMYHEQPYMRKPPAPRKNYWDSGGFYPDPMSRNQYQYQSCRYPPCNPTFYYPTQNIPPRFPQSAPQRYPQAAPMSGNPVVPTQAHLQAQMLKQDATKMSPLRLLRKKKMAAVGPASPPMRPAESQETPALDVRRFLATWADEEDEDVTPQLVVLDYQDINPEQAELLRWYESTANVQPEPAQEPKPVETEEKPSETLENVADAGIRDLLGTLTPPEKPAETNITTTLSPASDGDAMMPDLPTSEYRKNKFLDYSEPAAPLPVPVEALASQQQSSSHRKSKKRSRKSKPTIKFSIQKSHDLKISLRVLNEAGENRENDVPPPPVNEQDTINSRDQLITLSVASDDSSDKPHQNHHRRKKKKLPRQESEQSYSVSSEDPQSDATTDGFQVHESVDSAKIKLTFKRRKTESRDEVKKKHQRTPSFDHSDGETDKVPAEDSAPPPEAEMPAAVPEKISSTTNSTNLHPEKEHSNQEEKAEDLSIRREDWVEKALEEIWKSCDDKEKEQKTADLGFELDMPILEEDQKISAEEDLEQVPRRPSVIVNSIVQEVDRGCLKDDINELICNGSFCEHSNGDVEKTKHTTIESSLDGKMIENGFEVNETINDLEKDLVIKEVDLEINEIGSQALCDKNESQSIDTEGKEGEKIKEVTIFDENESQSIDHQSDHTSFCDLLVGSYSEPDGQEGSEDKVNDTINNESNDNLKENLEIEIYEIPNDVQGNKCLEKHFEESVRENSYKETAVENNQEENAMEKEREENSTTRCDIEIEKKSERFVTEKCDENSAKNFEEVTMEKCEGESIIETSVPEYNYNKEKDNTVLKEEEKDNEDEKNMNHAVVETETETEIEMEMEMEMEMETETETETQTETETGNRSNEDKIEEETNDKNVDLKTDNLDIYEVDDLQQRDKLEEEKQSDGTTQDEGKTEDPNSHKEIIPTKSPDKQNENVKDNCVENQEEISPLEANKESGDEPEQVQVLITDEVLNALSDGEECQLIISNSEEWDGLEVMEVVEEEQIEQQPQEDGELMDLELDVGVYEEEVGDSQEIDLNYSCQEEHSSGTEIDDAKFQDVMQSCLENASRFLNTLDDKEEKGEEYKSEKWQPRVVLKRLTGKVKKRPKKRFRNLYSGSSSASTEGEEEAKKAPVKKQKPLFGEALLKADEVLRKSVKKTANGAIKVNSNTAKKVLSLQEWKDSRKRNESRKEDTPSVKEKTKKEKVEDTKSDVKSKKCKLSKDNSEKTAKTDNVTEEKKQQKTTQENVDLKIVDKKKIVKKNSVSDKTQKNSPQKVENCKIPQELAKLDGKPSKIKTEEENRKLDEIQKLDFVKEEEKTLASEKIMKTKESQKPVDSVDANKPNLEADACNELATVDGKEKIIETEKVNSNLEEVEESEFGKERIELDIKRCAEETTTNAPLCEKDTVNDLLSMETKEKEREIVAESVKEVNSERECLKMLEIEKNNNLKEEVSREDLKSEKIELKKDEKKPKLHSPEPRINKNNSNNDNDDDKFLSRPKSKVPEENTCKNKQKKKELVDYTSSSSVESEKPSKVEFKSSSSCLKDRKRSYDDEKKLPDRYQSENKKYREDFEVEDCWSGRDSSRNPEKPELITNKRNVSEWEVTSSDESDEEPWICAVCNYSDASNRVAHIQTHAFYCRSCYLAFLSESYFIKHLRRKHPNIRRQHHCLLCELSFDTAEEYQNHIDTQEHRHLEAVEKNTINTLLTFLTGEPCPVLGPFENKPEWLPNQGGTVHFYNQATPLSLALQYLKMKHLGGPYK